MYKTWLFFLFFPCICFSKVYDCFSFSDELEALKIRLHELHDVVDYFVLVESVETLRGYPKKLYFKEHAHVFAPFSHKIIHIVLEERHPELGMWERENYQRDAILRGLTHCKDRDVILISDVDEIPKKTLIRYIKEELRRRSCLALAFQMKMYRYQLNRQNTKLPCWIGTIATIYSHLRLQSPQDFRNSRHEFWYFKNSGWRFTWIGDKEYVYQKFASIVEGSGVCFTEKSIISLMASVPIVPVDTTFPMYVFQHQEKLIEEGLIAKVPYTYLTQNKK